MIQMKFQMTAVLVAAKMMRFLIQAMILIRMIKFKIEKILYQLVFPIKIKIKMKKIRIIVKEINKDFVSNECMRLGLQQ